MVAAIKAFFGFGDSSSIIPRYQDLKTNPYVDILEVTNEILDSVGRRNTHTDTKNRPVHLRKPHPFSLNLTQHCHLCHNSKPD